MVVMTGATVICGIYLVLGGGDLDQNKIVVIKSELTIREISIVLKRENIISNAKIFEAVGRALSYITPLKSGEYQFKNKISPYQVFKILVKGRSILHKICIPEGYTVHQIINLINSIDKLTGTLNNNIAEGELMPSTYFYTYGQKREDVINRMRQAMSNVLYEMVMLLPSNSPLKTGKDILTLASIVEKETGNHQERLKIAGVFINRLNKGIKLQADTTLIYAITQGRESLNRPLQKRDTKIQSPYNTYYIYGLPPGPISCPGRAALESVISPVKTNALYFVASTSEKGVHNFSSTLQQHNSYVKKLKIKSRKQSTTK